MSAKRSARGKRPKLRGFSVLKIDAEHWWFFRVGYGTTVIRCKEGKLRHTVSNADLIGISNADFERGQQKKSADGMVLPSHIRRWVTENP